MALYLGNVLFMTTWRIVHMPRNLGASSVLKHMYVDRWCPFTNTCIHVHA